MTTVRVHPDVSAALRAGRAVVALETAVLTVGLPHEPLPADTIDWGILPNWNAEAPAHREALALMLRRVREVGAVPAVVGLIDGVLHVGLDEEAIDRLGDDPAAGKVGSADLAAAIAAGRTAGTTISATLAACGLPEGGVIRVLATGGIGGVHRGWTARPDISADLQQIARTPACVVCSGPKCILDVPATLSALEGLGVPVVGYRTKVLPGFLSGPSEGLTLAQTARTPQQAAAICQAHWTDLRALGGLLLAQATPEGPALHAAQVQRMVDAAEEEIRQQGIEGATRTPAMLASLARQSKGRTTIANIALLDSNARLAAEVALALA